MKIQIDIKKVAFSGIWIMGVGILFNVIETIYFGSNWLPNSKAELRCDIVAAEIVGAGIGLWGFAFVLKVKSLYNQSDVVERSVATKD